MFLLFIILHIHIVILSLPQAAIIWLYEYVVFVFIYEYAVFAVGPGIEPIGGKITIKQTTTPVQYTSTILTT